MSIVLFALIGAKLGMGTAYWICFSIFCICQVVSFIETIDIESIDS